MTEDGRRESEDIQWTVNTYRKFNFVVKCNFFWWNALQVAVQFLKREFRCRFHFFLCRCRNFAWEACRSSQFQLLHVAVSEPCRLSEFTLSGPLEWISTREWNACQMNALLPILTKLKQWNDLIISQLQAIFQPFSSYPPLGTFLSSSLPPKSR